MISLTPNTERIQDGETIYIKLNIQGNNNIKMYKNKYFNLNINKNGGNHGSSNLYPLRFNGFPLEWEVNRNSYKTFGTFNVSCVIQDGPLLNTTTFIVEEDCIIKKINTCNNINVFEQNKLLKSEFIKKEEQKIDYTNGCNIQKPGITIIPQKNIEPININIQNELICGGQVQKIGKNICSNI